jgi:hypothetical protein
VLPPIPVATALRLLPLPSDSCCNSTGFRDFREWLAGNFAVEITVGGWCCWLGTFDLPDEGNAPTMRVVVQSAAPGHEFLGNSVSG